MQASSATPALSLAMKYFNAWTNRDFKLAESCLSADTVFETPVNTYDTRQSFMQAVAYTAENASAIKLLSAIGNDKESVLIYDFFFSPIGNFRIAEHFIISNDKIIFIRHIHDTFELRRLAQENEGGKI